MQNKTRIQYFKFRFKIYIQIYQMQQPIMILKTTSNKVDKHKL